VLPPGHSWDDEGNKSSQCPKHGQCVSAFQMPTATRVAGFWTWKNLGRSVRAGQKGIRILAPIFGVRRKKDEEAKTSPSRTSPYRLDSAMPMCSMCHRPTALSRVR
jgi:hypothetical protein